MSTFPFAPSVHPEVAEALEVRAEKLVGLLPAELIRTVEIERPSASLISGYRALPDLTSLVADILDELGFDTAIPAGSLAPLAPGQRVVGPAVTVRHSRVRRLAGRSDGAPRLGGLDQISLMQAGDVLVIDAGGEEAASSFGGLMAAAALQRQLAGIVVDGCVRDAETMRRAGLGVWSRSTTPRTGKHRLELVEFNGAVDIAGTQVWPGDIVLADSDGVLIVPSIVADEVLAKAQAAAQRETVVVNSIAEGASVEESLAILPPEKW